MIFEFTKTAHNFDGKRFFLNISGYDKLWDRIDELFWTLKNKMLKMLARSCRVNFQTKLCFNKIKTLAPEDNRGESIESDQKIRQDTISAKRWSFRRIFVPFNVSILSFIW